MQQYLFGYHFGSVTHDGSLLNRSLVDDLMIRGVEFDTAGELCERSMAVISRNI